MENINSLHIITNNIKVVQKKNKRLYIVEYFKNKVGKNWLLFLQETHLTTSNEGKWKDEFSGPVFIHMVLVTLVVYWLRSLGKICANSQIIDKHGRIIILDITLM